MENNYFQNIPGTFLKRAVLLFVLMFIGFLNLNAQVRIGFKERTSKETPSREVYHIRGDFGMIGNTNMTLQSYASNINNSNNLMKAVDEDNNENTKNSSSAFLSFSDENGANTACTNVLFAGLYWTGRTNNEVTDYRKKKIKLKGPDQNSYENFTAKEIRFPGDGNMYVGYVEVTDLVRNSGEGEYWVADMAVTEGNGGTTGYYGGWGMVVVYENANMNWRDVTVFDGYAYVKGNATLNYELPVSGFYTTQAGPVNMKLGIMAGEGDTGISGDYFEIQKNSDKSWLRLSHAQNQPNNFFDSSIETWDNQKKPNLTNNTGIDISMFSIPNDNNSVIANSQSSTKFRYGSTQDTYNIYNIVMSVDAYIPEVEGLQSVEPAKKKGKGEDGDEEEDENEGRNNDFLFSITPGEEILYKIELKNKGTEPIADTKIIVPVPYNVNYVENSGKGKFHFSSSFSSNNIYFNPDLGPQGSVVWEVDTLPLPKRTDKVLAELELKFKVTEDCSVLSFICDAGGEIEFGGELSGRGAITGTVFEHIQLIQGFERGTCRGQPISFPLKVRIQAEEFTAENCGSTYENIVFTYCSPQAAIEIDEIKTDFPVGTRFYNEYPISTNSVEYTSSNPFPNTGGSTEYYAISPASETCYLPFKIQIDEIASVPSAVDIKYCVNAEAAPLTATATDSSYILYYFKSIDSEPQTELIPGTDEIGEFTYYVAEGLSTTCISKKVPLKVTVVGGPEISVPAKLSLEACAVTDITKENARFPYSETTSSDIKKIFEAEGYTVSEHSEIKSITYKDIITNSTYPKRIERTFTITDQCNNQDTAVLIIILNDTTAPTAPHLETATGECEITVTAPTTTDNCTGTITGTTNDSLTYSEQGEYEITWNFNDGNGNSTTAIQKVIVDDKTAPEAMEIPTATGECEVTVTAPTTTDNCIGTITGTTNDSLTYSEQGEYEITWNFNDGNGNSTTAIQKVIVDDKTAPEAIEIPTATGECEVTVTAPTTTDNCTGTITGTTTDPITYSEQGEYTITWNFDDGNGNSTTSTQKVVVNDKTAPEAIEISTATGECEVTVTAPTTTDNCTGTITGTTTDPLTYSEQGEYEITWTFDDGNGNSTTATQKVIVNDKTAPEAIEIPTATGECEVTVTPPTTTDGCSGDKITGTTNDPLTYSKQGEYEITWNFNDGNGNSTTATQKVIVDDKTAPEAIEISTATGECEVTVTAPTTTDNCTGTITGTTTDPLTYSEQGTFEITWTFDDGNGNSTTSTQKVVVNDKTAPEAIEITTATGECEVTVTAPTTTDNCAGTITGTINDPLTYSKQGEYKITWTFSDGNGNSTTAIQKVIVDDKTAPEAIEIPTATGECEVTVTAPTTTDNCAGTITGTTNDPLTYSKQGEYKITWTFDDGNGNSTTATQKVIVDDTTAPVTPTIADATGECEVTVEAPTTTDGCSGEVITGTTTDPTTYSEQGEYKITWNFNDGNGNSTSAIQKVVVDDTTAPVTPTIADATGECEITVEAPTTTDGCSGEVITGTTTDPLTYSKQGTFEITWNFDDGNGNSTTATQKVVVDDKTAPVIPTIADATGECEVTVTAPTTTDNCVGTITGTTTDPLTYSEQGEYEITWNFNDGNGNSTSATQKVIVDDKTAPEAIEIPDATAECEVTVVAPTTTDGCSGEVITGTTTDPTTYSEQGEYEITWTFDDGNGNSTSAIQKVIVDDKTAPEAIEIPTATGECEVTVTAPTTTDNCTGTITGTTTDPLTYSEQGTFEITWTFDDGNGNSITSIQKVIVDDKTAPEAIEITTATGECEITVTAPTTTDNCAGTITGTTTDPLTYSEQGEYEITWTFDDGNGNSTTATQKVIVNDKTAPEEITIPDAIGECEVTVTPPTTTDGCSGDKITGTTTDSLTYYEQGEYEITWVFDDGNGNSTTAIQKVIVDDKTAPEAIEIPTATGECEVTVTAPTTTDNCAGTITGTTTDSLTYSKQGEYEITWKFNDGNGNSTTATQKVVVDDKTAPEAIEISTATGECEVSVSAPTTIDNCAGTITGTTTDPLTYSEQGEYEITWNFNDGHGNSTTATQKVIVDDKTAPEVIKIPTATGECEVTVIAPTTTDNCSGTITGTTTDLITYSEQGTFEITWTFDDGNGNSTSAIQKVVVDDKTAPETIEISTATGECEVTVTAPTTTDNCTGTITGTTSDPLTYSEQGEYEITWTFDDGNGNSTSATQKVIVDDKTAPEKIVIPDATGECEITVEVPTTTDNCSGTITGTTTDPMTYSEQGTFEIIWNFNDGNGNSTTATQKVVVDDKTTPVTPTIADATGECEVTVIAPTTTDNCVGTITGTTTDPMTYSEQGEYEITWNFDDGNGNSTTAIQKVIVDDKTAPNSIEIPDATAECEVTVIAPTTTDNCIGTITGTTTDPLTYSEQGEYTITWAFDDGNGNTTTAIQKVVVDDKTAPEAIEVPTATGECAVTVTAPTTTDNCTGTITGTTTDPLTYSEQGEYKITWTFDDGNGNSTSATQKVIVDDKTAPETIEIPTATGECEVTVEVPTTTDNCTGTITGTTTDPMTYSEQGEYEITWNFDDGNGNSTTTIQKVIVDDKTAPEAIEIPTTTGECEVTVTAPTTTDNCAGTITGTTNDPLTYPEQGEYTITWTFDDGNGNSTSATQKVIVDDKTAPIWISSLPQNITASCSEVPNAPQLSAEDNCVVNVTFSEEIINSDCASEYSISRTWIAIDLNNNSITHAQTITVVDTTAPTLIGELEETINVTCGEIPMAPELDFEDNCSGVTSVDFKEESEDTENGGFNITRTWTVTDCAGNASEFVQTVHVLSTIIETTTVDLCTEDSEFDLNQLLLGDYNENGTWSDPQNTGALNQNSIDPGLLEVGQYEFDYIIEEGDCSFTTTVAVHINDDCVVLPCSIDDIKSSISKTVTPNGDNRNDFFTIGLSVDCGFTYSVKIFNRWGNMVYQSENYQNNWDGTSTNSVTSSNQLPAGTYYYIVDINQEGIAPIQSFIYLGTK